jgi:hypothetical protein
MREAENELSLLRFIRSSRGRLRHLTRSLSVLMVIVLVLGFVEERGDEVENAVLYVRGKYCFKQPPSVNLRANDGSDECSPW